MYDGLDGWEVESVYNSLELARIRLEFIRSLKLRVSPYIQEIEIGDKTLTLEIAKEIQEKNIRKTIKSLKADVVW
jgi:recombinational DNA repair ATPase RecF